MKRVYKYWLCLIVAATSLLAVDARAQPPKNGGGGGGSTSPSYDILALDSAPSFAWDITQHTPDGARLIAGSVQLATGSDFQAACWVLIGSGSQTLVTRHLLADFGHSGASGVASNGAIVGSGMGDDGSDVALYWADRNAAPIQLPGLPEEDFSHALRLNAAGVVIGGSYRQLDENTYQRRALCWRVDHGIASPPVLLPSLFPGDPSGAMDDLCNAHSGVDANGLIRVVGSSNGVPVVWLLTLSADGELTVDPAAPYALDLVGEAAGLNRTGATCGDDGWDAVIWDDGSRQVLAWDSRVFLEPGSPTDINVTRAVVGRAREKRHGREQAVLWSSPTGPMQSLDRFLPKNNSPFTYLKYASAINDADEIVGHGWHGSSGTNRAFLALTK